MKKSSVKKPSQNDFITAVVVLRSEAGCCLDDEKRQSLLRIVDYLDTAWLKAYPAPK